MNEREHLCRLLAGYIAGLAGRDIRTGDVSCGQIYSEPFCAGLAQGRQHARTEPLAEAILAVDRLNSWVRAGNFYRIGNGSLREWIYHLKGQVIKTTLRTGLITQVRRVQAIVKCRRCSGTGIYTDEYGQDRGQCRGCSGGWGKARLRFIETTLGHPVHLRWHTPVERWSSIVGPGHPDYLRSWWQAEYETASDWEPNAAGHELTLEEACAALNVAEAYFPLPSRPRRIYSDRWLVEDSRYSLDVGYLDPDLCRICEVRPPDYPSYLGVYRGRIHWAEKSCTVCANAPVIAGSASDRFPLPEALIAAPAVQEWIRRHPAKAERRAA